MEEGWVCSVVLFHFAHKLHDELECSWSSDVVRVNILEFHILLVEGCLDLGGEALHDVLVEVRGEVNVVDVVGVVELLDHFQVGLQGFDLWS